MDDDLLAAVKWEDMVRAVKYSGNSAPGPDGIPYSAYRALGKGAVGALFEVASQLVADEDFINYLDFDFNHSILVCLPTLLLVWVLEFGKL